jgi:hypothetical protein
VAVLHHDLRPEATVPEFRPGDRFCTIARCGPMIRCAFSTAAPRPRTGQVEPRVVLWLLASNAAGGSAISAHTCQ